VSVSLPPADALVQFCERLQVGDAVAFRDHPWRDRATGALKAAELVLDPLKARAWPVVVQHGDLVPWNRVEDALDYLSIQSLNS